MNPDDDPEPRSAPMGSSDRLVDAIGADEAAALRTTLDRHGLTVLRTEEVDRLREVDAAYRRLGRLVPGSGTAPD